MIETKLDANMNKLTQPLTALEIAAQLRAGSNGLLTKKEALVAFYLLDDHSVKEIARRQCRSKNTVKMHIRNMKRKCHCEARTRLGSVLQTFLKNNPGGDIKNYVKD